MELFPVYISLHARPKTLLKAVMVRKILQFSRSQFNTSVQQEDFETNLELVMQNAQATVFGFAHTPIKIIPLLAPK